MSISSASFVAAYQRVEAHSRGLPYWPLSAVTLIGQKMDGSSVPKADINESQLCGELVL